MDNFYFKPSNGPHPKDREIIKYKKVKIKEDSLHRREIHERIIKLIKTRKLKGLDFSKEDILATINSEFSESKYIDFFPSWVEHAIIQEKKRQPNRSREIQNRIIELYKLGFPQEQALIRLFSEYSNSKLVDFFEKWVEKGYKEQSEKEKRLKEPTKCDDGERA